MGICKTFFMDIWLIDSEEGTQLCPKSIHGMLWLQTHFSDTHWEAIASKEVVLSLVDAKALSKDAKEAGLSINHFSVLSITRTF